LSFSVCFFFMSVVFYFFISTVHDRMAEVFQTETWTSYECAHIEDEATVGPRAYLFTRQPDKTE